MAAVSDVKAVNWYSKVSYDRGRRQPATAKAYVLKPCPFCGEISGKVHYRLIENQPHYWVRCENLKGCLVNPKTYDFGTEQEAVIAWNKRGG